MRKFICVTTIFAFFLLINAWQLSLKISEKPSFTLAIGMKDSATDLFDPRIDRAAPPILPTGIFPYMPIWDKKYPYIRSLWWDIRSPKDSATWKIIIHNMKDSVTITWPNDSLPKGKLTINNYDMRKLAGKFVAPPNDTIIIIKYFKKPLGSFLPGNIKFSLPDDAKNVSIVIVDEGGNLQDRVELGSLKAGEHSISWQPKKTSDSGKFYYFAIIADGKQVDSGRFSPAGKK